jgi:hypothetical protein
MRILSVECSIGLVSVVGFEMEPKIGAKTTWDGGIEISLSGNAFSTPIEKGAETLQAGTGGHGKDLVAVQAPQMAIPHIHNKG